MANKPVQHFENMVENGLHVVEFTAAWCGGGESHDFFEREAPQLYKLHYTSCDVEERPELSARLGVFSVPTWIFFKDGTEVDRFVGHGARERFLAYMTGDTKLRNVTQSMVQNSSNQY